ncbi:precorrin-6y C5,15-methyltransferase (decarboxylating) subunit CbiE [Clostridium hydrogeniformans]|uniref:precorrin-6y C5,15-methyltransferase (decarboxylating) subunit CbiE n=1 Tax=Clostridium hydrogeniformans TaxID=349933 RepID=UPI0004885632|nr:precorrin-6y C5,15-methyltransferase (decarboxylating) subunit CbiE [Clostridium hydrogeniformans]
MIYIVGLGPGHKDYIVPRAIEILNKADLVIGFKRAIESLDFIDNRKIIVESLKETLKIINENKDKNIGLVASGDPTFYGISNYIKNNYEGKVVITPGISSFQYLACAVGKSWNEALVSSVHGRKADFIKEVLNKKLSFWLTDKENNPKRLCELLLENSIKCNVFIGENLSYENEIIANGSPEELINREYSDLSVVVVEVI